MVYAAKIPCARKKNIFAASPTRAAEFEVKNRCKSFDEEKVQHLLFLLLFFEVRY